MSLGFTFVGTIGKGASSLSSQPGVSGTFTPDAFNQMITDSSSFSVTLDSGERNAIQWIAAKDRILIGTTGGEWRMSGHSNKPLTPTNYDLKPQTVWGSKDMQPLVLHESVMFVDYVGRKLRELVWDGTEERYRSPDLMLLADHITLSGGITTMAYQRNPDSIIWATLANGELISCTYDKEQDVVAWARHPMETGSGYVLSGGYPTLQVADGTFARQYTDADLPSMPHTTTISNVTELQAIADDLDGNYYLTQDIDASATAAWNAGAGFVPIEPFAGTLDGCGYTVTGLVINRAGTSNQGFMGTYEHEATSDIVIANLTLKDISVTGDDTSGMFFTNLTATVGYSVGIYVQNCHVTGDSYLHLEGTPIDEHGGFASNIAGETGKNIKIYDCTTTAIVDCTGATDTGYTNIGGFFGYAADCEFRNCRATGNIIATTGAAGGQRVGGFGGQTDGTEDAPVLIYDCTATGNVTGYRVVGGFIGFTNGNTILRCSSRGDVIGNDTVGGFVADNYAYSTITDCYSWGDVTAIGGPFLYAGGFCQYNEDATTVITNSYSIGAVTGTSIGGFCQWNNGGTITTSFWDTETSGTEISDDGVGHTTIWMKTKHNYELNGWDFGSTWEIAALPVLVGTSVCVIPGSAEDEVWLTVVREINGSQVGHIERMAPRNWGTDQEDCFFVDSGLTYDGDATTTFTGLDHLEGETVAILGDGAVFPTQTVTNGTVTLPEAVSVCHIGLPFTSTLKPVRYDTSTAQGTSKGSIKKITKFTVSFYKTLGARYGDGTNYRDFKWRETTDPYTTPPALVTGDKDGTFDGGYNSEDPFEITVSDPVPCTVRAIILRLEQTGY